MSAPTPRPTRLPRSPVVLRGGRWWLVSSAGTIPAIDPAFTGTLDRLSMAMAAADLAVAELRTRQDDSSASSAGSPR